jgi:alpha-beta hydrolase superfamily lysophospholipase
MIKEIMDASQKLRGLSYYMKIPSLFMVAGADYLVDPESTTLFAGGIDKKLTQVLQYPDQHHELWNEINRHEIFETMRRWVDKQLKENP